ncbi:MAG: c-type cytochrome [Polyangiaceae bacterium]
MKAMRGWALLGASLAAFSVGACGGDDDNPSNPDAGKSDAATDTRADMSTSNDGRTDTTTTDSRDTGTADNRDGAGEAGGEGGVDGGDGGSPVQRGEYLVKSIGACGDCHTPRNLMGQPDTGRFLAGMNGIFQIPGLGPDGGPGVIGTSNLTPDMTTGLGSWTDAQIKNAMLNGIDKDGKPLFPIMPYYVLHNMSDADADAIVAYLRTIPPIANPINPRNFDLPGAAPPVPADRIPNPTLPTTDPNYASAMRGKYLAGNIGVCMECHTKHVQTPGMVPLELDKLFAGGETFVSAALGLPPQFPPTITTENITPHATGVQGWTAQAVATVLKMGVNKDGLPICPPMPNGPNGAFAGITDNDARDIGNYIIHLPPIDNLIPQICHNVMTSDGGTDGGSDSAADGTADTGGDTATPPDATTDTPADNAAPDTGADTGGGSDGSDGSSNDGASDGATDGATDGSNGDAAGDGSNDGAG